mmetsp:Transcript_61721/g.98353  ORF Transcript_61721/g.98353 Transcript_61721/m.98353 type:complete len:213 (+) Transcript_61721:278-916(+)
MLLPQIHLPSVSLLSTQLTHRALHLCHHLLYRAPSPHSNRERRQKYIVHRLLATQPRRIPKTETRSQIRLRLHSIPRDHVEPMDAFQVCQTHRFHVAISHRDSASSPHSDHLLAQKNRQPQTRCLGLAISSLHSPAQHLRRHLVTHEQDLHLWLRHQQQTLHLFVDVLFYRFPAHSLSHLLPLLEHARYRQFDLFAYPHSKHSVRHGVHAHV